MKAEIDTSYKKCVWWGLLVLIKQKKPKRKKENYTVSTLFKVIKINAKYKLSK